jgi:hypothetical protein
MKSIVTVLGDTLAAVALVVAGLSLQHVTDAPNWLMAVFLLPFLVFLHFRLETGFRFILWFVVLSTIVSLAFHLFLPPEYRYYSGGVVVVLLAPLVDRLRGPKRQIHDDQTA